MKTVFYVQLKLVVPDISNLWMILCRFFIITALHFFLYWNYFLSPEYRKHSWAFFFFFQFLKRWKASILDNGKLFTNITNDSCIQTENISLASNIITEKKKCLRVSEPRFHLQNGKNYNDLTGSFWEINEVLQKKKMFITVPSILWALNIS